MSQFDLSRAIGAHQMYINRLESTKAHNPGTKYSLSIVKVLNDKFIEMGLNVRVSVEDLLIPK